MSELSHLERQGLLPDAAASAARSHTLGRLAEALAHEIRNPLTTVFLHADILEEALQQADPDGPQLVHFVRVMRAEVRRVDELIQQYLWLARLPYLERHPEDLGLQLEAFGLEMRDVLTAHGITLALEGIHTLGSLDLHPPTFQRLLRHVCQNALEAMPHGGTLRICGQRSASCIRLEISDTGCGLSPAVLPHVCEPLYTTHAGKLGLGLYIAQEIVRAHAGELTLTSQPGIGTTVGLTFPLTPTIPSA